MIDNPLKILVLGASYGLLPGVKLALAGHELTFVGRVKEIASLRADGLHLQIPLRHSTTIAHLHCDSAAFCTPDQAEPEKADCILLAMQEPQFANPDLSALMRRIAASRRPCLSIMNLPPPPFLARLGISGDVLDGVYRSTQAWHGFDPAQVSNASPDPQALRMDPARPGDLTVTLASNFKAAPFVHAQDQAVLQQMARTMSRLKVELQGKPSITPVHLLAHSSAFIPLAKWPMLIAGNARCLTKDGVCSIAEAVLSAPPESKTIYDHVAAMVVALGVPEEILVPFDAYAAAAAQLSRPSSAARALTSGAQHVERIDLLVSNLMQQASMDTSFIAPIVTRVEERLAANRRAK